MAKVYATRAQVVKINDILREHLKPAEGGLFAYDGEWSDATVAEAVATTENPIQKWHVQHVREEIFGNLVERKTSTEEARILALEVSLAAERARSDRLESRLAELHSLHAKLCKSLTVNHVLAVSHLAGPAPDKPNGAAIHGTTRMGAETLPGVVR